METLDLNCQEAAFPLIIWIAVAIGTLFAAIIISIINVPLDYDIAILGNQGAGKTTLWNAITSKSSKIEQTQDRERIEKTIVTIGGVKRKIKQSYDVSGGEDSVKHYYEELCQKKTFIIYIFDSYKYEQDVEYKTDVLGRLRKIGHEISKQKEEKNIHIIGSHIDKLANNKKELKNIHAKLENELLKEINKNFNNQLEKDKNFILLDLSNKKALTTYIEKKLFNN